ncbi:MAG: GNAT family N-acetyltransferase [Oscillospiraceae bacterium]|nr:GNAT family N-acetyltransferase [Oscillospiraceae bacterium]
MITKRRYKILVDFERVHKFLTETYDINCTLLPQYFEYAHMHGYFDYFNTHHFGIWEDNGKIIGIACYEMILGESCHLHTHKNYKFLLPELLEWAEYNLYGIKDGKRILEIEIMEKEPEKRELLKSTDYLIAYSGPCNIYPYDKPFPECKLPEGFTLIDGTNADYVKIHHCFYKGFDHGDDINDADANGRIFACNAPNVDLSLWTYIVAPDGEYACGLGMWYDKTNKYAYLEPLATIPKYRRMGLATVCLTEAMKKTKELGAKYCFGGSREFYTDIGFETIMNYETWKKEW